MILVSNKTAKRDYEILKTYTAGIVLSGAEVKSLRLKHASLKGSYIKVIGNELLLINAQINPYCFADNKEYDPKKSRKLLLKKKEIYQLKEVTDKKKVAIVPLSFDLVGNRLKLQLGVGKGKKEFEKRADIKKRDLDRQVEVSLKSQRINY